MKEVLELIKEKRLIKAGEKVGVAVSGGVDSMALLHFLNDISKEIGFSLIALTINHQIRQEAENDVAVVEQFCAQNKIKVHAFKISAPDLAEKEKLSLETAARHVRYGVFDSLLKKRIVNKIALAHHKDDQAETVLMNLFRGAGLRGISGMEVARQDGYIRPFLQISKKKIELYAKHHSLPFVIDKTNFEDDYARNFLRNQIMPLIKKQWENATDAIVNFSQDCAQDDEFISESINFDGVLVLDRLAKIPQSYFLNEDAIVSRIIFEALHRIGVTKDIERKHIKLIKDFALKSETGKKVSLPNKLQMIKEYDYIVFQNKFEEPKILSLPFKAGKFEIEGWGIVQGTSLFVDGNKIPKGAFWRFHQTKDIFEKFGGGTKKVKDFLVDKKVSARERRLLPLLAFQSQIYAIADVEISQKAKVDKDSKVVFQITKIK